MIHRVEQGECCHSLAARYGLESGQSIYEDPANAALRKTRPSPDLLYPGDEVFVPERSKKTERCASNARHVFSLTTPKVKLRVVLRNDRHQPIANKRYRVRALGLERAGRTDGQGVVEQPIPASLASVDLEVWLDDAGQEPDLEYSLLLGHLDPIDTDSGVLARLHNLGYRCAAADEMSETAHAAVRAFRHDHGLEAGDAIDDALRQRLSREHDGG